MPWALLAGAIRYTIMYGAAQHVLCVKCLTNGLLGGVGMFQPFTGKETNDGQLTKLSQIDDTLFGEADDEMRIPLHMDNASLDECNNKFFYRNDKFFLSPPLYQ